MSDFPFSERKLEWGNNVFLREFQETIESDELIWHLDREDRKVTVLEGESWMLQMDNQLPVLLESGRIYHIPAYTYHRVIKGSGNLKVVVEKLL